MPEPRSGYKPLLVFINPCSGTGIAKKLYRKHLLPNLNQLEVPHEVITTGKVIRFDLNQKMCIKWSILEVIKLN